MMTELEKLKEEFTVLSAAVTSSDDAIDELRDEEIRNEFASCLIFQSAVN